MLYLILKILFFLLVAALLGFVIGWLLRGSRFQSELQDLDARWRSKLGEVESERDRFAGEVTQANDARARLEASAAEAQRLAETHESSLEQLRREHKTKLGLLSDAEKRVGGLEGDLASRKKELADAQASLAKQQGAGGDSARLGRDLAAATARTESLERDLKQAREANGTCRREVERLEARIAELQRAGSGSASGGALGLVGSTGGSTGTTGSGSAGTDSAGGASGSAASSGAGGGSAGTAGGSGSTGGALGLVGGTNDASGAGSSGGESGLSGRSEPGYRQQAASPGSLAETASQSFAAPGGSGSSAGDQETEGLRPEALSQARGGIADDLKKISGVGPKLEKTLNGLGIFHFSQIAAFTPDNVAWVDRHLRFKGRIERENWIEQAKVLAAGGDTEFSQRS